VLLAVVGILVVFVIDMGWRPASATWHLWSAIFLGLMLSLMLLDCLMGL
jgi:hypothetical protein